MQKILGDAKSVEDILRQKYQIDFYQRDYQWTTKQIRELIEDLTSRFLQDFRDDHLRHEVAHYGQYFLGSIIVGERENDRFIVDGQQRLTSLTLLFIYLDALQQVRGDEDIVDVAGLIYSVRYGEKSFNLDVPERNPCLQSFVDGVIPDPADQPPSVQNLINRFLDITECFPEELRDTGLPYFIDWLKEKVMLVEITAFSDNDAYTIFETMNDRGLSLTPTDMLKGYLLANISGEESRAYSEDVWKKQIGRLQELGKDEETDCIKSWLRSQYAKNIRRRRSGAQPEDFDRIGTEFHRWVREHRNSVGLESSEDFASFITQDLTFYGRAYRVARETAENYTPDFESSFFNAQNSFTLQYPLMLAPLRLSDNEDTMHRKMRLVATFIEIMLARRIWNFRAIDHSTMQYRAFLIMRDIRGREFENLREYLIRLLSPLSPEQDEYIDFHTQEAFRLHGTNSPQVHRLLARLTDFLEVKSGRGSRYPEYAKRSSRKGGYQIEHIWADHAERHGDEFAHPSEFASYRNRIGGLLLLPASHNASYSDKAYEEKVKLYSKENLLACSLHPIAYENDPDFRRFREGSSLQFGPKAHFLKSDLDDRQQLYVELAELCWSPDKLKTI